MHFYKVATFAIKPCIEWILISFYILQVPVRLLVLLYSIENANSLYIGYFCMFFGTFVLFRRKLQLKPTLSSGEVKELEKFKNIIVNSLMKKKVLKVRWFLFLVLKCKLYSIKQCLSTIWALFPPWCHTVPVLKTLAMC